MKVFSFIPSLATVHGSLSHVMWQVDQALLMQNIEVETVTTDNNGTMLLVPRFI